MSPSFPPRFSGLVTSIHTQTFIMPIHMRALLKPRASGPFEPLAAILGGTPTPNLDVPITVFFLMLFIIGGGFHLYTHEINKKRQHKFHLSALMFDFCLVRTLTCTMRIVWAYRPNNNGIILTALIFENAGYVFQNHILFKSY